MTELPAIWQRIHPDLVDMLRKKKLGITDEGRDDKGYYIEFKKFGKKFYLRLTI